MRLRAGADLVEDVVTLLVPGGAADEILPPPPGTEIDTGLQTKGTAADVSRQLGLEVIAPKQQQLVVAPGASARYTLRLRSQASDRIDGEAMPVSPWGAWGLVGPYAKGFSVAPNSETELSFDVTAPIDAPPGHWWLMVKLMWYGRVQYTPAVSLVVEHR
ncbi:MAG: hypothetical protein ACRDT8_10725, partial [Micromonosporaceae bacterium]